MFPMKFLGQIAFHTMRTFAPTFAMSVSLCFLAIQTRAEEMKPCFACNAKGVEACRACDHGKKNCPAPCLKLNVGTWEHLDVAGHSPNELWQKFPYVKDGRNGYQAWTQAHIGEVIEMHNGEPVNAGQCKMCAGTTKVACVKCRGSGAVACTMCDGKRQVPASWSATNNPKIDSDPSYIRLKDGTVVKGRITMQFGNVVTIKTDDGRKLELAADQIVPRAATPKNPPRP